MKNNPKIKSLDEEQTQNNLTFSSNYKNEPINIDKKYQVRKSSYQDLSLQNDQQFLSSNCQNLKGQQQQIFAKNLITQKKPKNVEIGGIQMNVSIFSDTKNPVQQKFHTIKQKKQQQFPSSFKESSIKIVKIHQQKPYIEMQSQSSKQQKIKFNIPPIQIQYTHKMYYFVHEKSHLPVTIETLNRLSEQFFKANVYIPIFNSLLLQNWIACKDQSKYQNQNQIHLTLKNYLIQYVNYLNKMYRSQFVSIITQIIRKEKDINKIQENAWWQTFSLKNVVKSLKKMINLPKTELAKHTINTKIECYKTLKNCFDQLNMKTQEDVKTSNACLNKIQQGYIKMSKLQFLRSFQHTQEDCAQKIEFLAGTKYKTQYQNYKDQIFNAKFKYINSELKTIEI